MSGGIDFRNLLTTTFNTLSTQHSDKNDEQKKSLKPGYLSNGQLNCVFDANIAATAGSHKTAAGDY